MYRIFFAILLVLLLSGCSVGYKKENGAVYYQYWNEGLGFKTERYLLQDADPETFVILKNDDYAKDDNNVFYQGELIKYADAASFESLDEVYARDKYRGYYEKSPIKSSNGKTFKVIGGDYSTDGTDVFYTTHELHVCSTKSFTIQREDWATDGCYYYYRFEKIPSPDYKNVKVFEGSAGFAADKQFVYFGNHRLNYDDSGQRILDTVDVVTFTVKNFIDCSDKFGCINPYHGREDCR